jgi:hypothetical protein
MAANWSHAGKQLKRHSTNIASHATQNTSPIIRRSCFARLTSFIIRHTLHVTIRRQTSHFTPTNIASHATQNTSPIIRRSCFARLTSFIIRHTLHVTIRRQTSHFTLHTSHLTPHTSHLTLQFHARAMSLQLLQNERHKALVNTFNFFAKYRCFVVALIPLLRRR